MRASNALLEAQTAVFERVDPLLPVATRPPEGDVLTAAMPDGERVAGVLVRTWIEPGTAPTLWSPLETWELHPLLGGVGGDGMEALLREWRRVLSLHPTAEDSACLLTWPSRDAEVNKPLLAHGFVPLTSIAVRTGATVPPPAGSHVRLAGPRDLETALDLELAELRYSALVGAALDRPDAARIKRAALTHHLEQGDPVWLAERDGVPVGLAHCRLIDVETGSLSALRLRPGRWGYVNCVSVVEDTRGTGVGQSLMAAAHHELHRRGATGTFLYYHPPNPLASVFWARQGYRPLWTSWELRPAGALR